MMFLKSFRLAAAFLTRLPIPLSPPDESAGTEDRGLLDALPWFPLVGALIGLATGALALLAAQILPSPIAALLALSAQVLLTGGLHEDGLADVADGFGGGRDRERKLAIMRDSRLGSYGAIALVLSLGLRAACLTFWLDRMGGNWTGENSQAGIWAFAAVAAWSRALLPLLMITLRPARSDGLGRSAGEPTAALAIGSILTGAVLTLFLLPWLPAVLMLAFGLLAIALLGLLARRQIGGYTGDVLGAAQQLTEIASWLALLARLG